MRTAVIPLLLGAVVTASAPGVIRIKAGDTLWALARTHHTTVAALKQANGLHGDTIYVGQLLKIPGNNATPAAGATSDIRYRVRPGDTVYALARKYGASPASIAQRNNLDARCTIYIGSTLLIPVPARSSGTTSSSSSGTSNVATQADRDRATLASRAQPSKTYVQSLIRSAAARVGVDPALALAVAYQESGFQQDVVSPVGAIGAMQVMPATGRWLASDIVGRPLDLLDVHDNVYAGVTLLGMLVRSAGASTGVAGYYQGLASVRAKGMYRDTQSYVNAVLALRARFA